MYPNSVNVIPNLPVIQANILNNYWSLLLSSPINQGLISQNSYTSIKCIHLFVAPLPFFLRIIAIDFHLLHLPLIVTIYKPISHSNQRDIFFEVLIWLCHLLLRIFHWLPSAAEWSMDFCMTSRYLLQPTFSSLMSDWLPLCALYLRQIVNSASLQTHDNLLYFYSFAHAILSTWYPLFPLTTVPLVIYSCSLYLRSDNTFFKAYSFNSFPPCSGKPD